MTWSILGLPEDIYDSYNTLSRLLQELGLEISQSKLVAPLAVLYV